MTQVTLLKKTVLAWQHEEESHSNFSKLVQILKTNWRWEKQSDDCSLTLFDYWKVNSTHGENAFSVKEYKIACRLVTPCTFLYDHPHSKFDTETILEFYNEQLSLTFIDNQYQHQSDWSGERVKCCITESDLIFIVS